MNPLIILEPRVKSVEFRAELYSSEAKNHELGVETNETLTFFVLFIA